MYILDVWFMPMILFYSLLQFSLFAVGKAHNTHHDSLRIGHDTFLWNNSLKYLGVYFK